TPPEQPNAMAVSYNPFDTIANGGASNPDYTQFYSNPHTATQELCKQIFKDHTPQGLTIEGLYPICDQFLWLQAAFKGAPSLTPQNLPQVLLDGTDKLGCSYVPAVGYANPCVGPPYRYDGAS